MRENSTYNKSTKNKLFLSIMIFAFLWVIIGDLVNMHVRVITGKDLYGHHQPFSKTHKSNGKTFKVGSKKINKTTNNSIVNLFFSESIQATFLSHTKDFLYWFIPQLVAENSSKCSLGRAPPYSV